MNKINFPSGNSTTSPETSDLQGFGDDYATTLTRATKNWKKFKEISEIEDKRPPWQIVGLSTLPKADKTAILRAKLLDASRRMRLGKIPVGIQTDIIPTKLMKEVNIDIQTDLIEMKDAEILTDGSITLRTEGVGEFLLTHSVAQMTDVVLATEAQTQTETPRITNNFFEKYFNKRLTLPDDEEREENLSKNEKKLLKQIKDIRQIDEQLNGNNQKECERNDSELSDDSLVDDEDESNKYINKIMRRKPYKVPKYVLKPTIPSWYFDLSDDEGPSTQASQKRCFTESNRPWSSFNDDLIDNKLANMKLVPVPAKKCGIKKKSIIWSDAQHNAVVDLINEANSLLDVFEEMSILLGPDIKLNELPEKDNTHINFLSDYWEPILHESAQILEIKMSTLQNLPIKKVEPISPEMLERVI